MNIEIVVLTDDFEQQWHALRTAAARETSATIAVQLHASWIIHRGLWQQAEESYFYDVASGDRYLDIKDVPEGVTCRRHRAQRWTSRKDFLGYMDENVARMGYSTFWKRHREIMRELTLWGLANSTEDVPEEVFRDTVQSVVAGGRTIGELVCDNVFNFGSSDRFKLAPVDSVRKDVAARLPGITDEDLATLPEDEMRVTVAAKALEYIKEQRAEVDGSRGLREATASVRQTIARTPFIIARRTEDGEIQIHVELSEVSDIGEWVVDMPRKFTVVFLDETRARWKMKNLPTDLQEWLKRRLRLF